MLVSSLDSEHIKNHQAHSTVVAGRRDSHRHGQAMASLEDFSGKLLLTY